MNWPAYPQNTIKSCEGIIWLFAPPAPLKTEIQTCAISSVFLSFSSQVTVISWISFSDSSKRSFSSGDFIACEVAERKGERKQEKEYFSQIPLLKAGGCVVGSQLSYHCDPSCWEKEPKMLRSGIGSRDVWGFSWGHRHGKRTSLAKRDLISAKQTVIRWPRSVPRWGELKGAGRRGTLGCQKSRKTNLKKTTTRERDLRCLAETKQLYGNSLMSCKLEGCHSIKGTHSCMNFAYEWAPFFRVAFIGPRRSYDKRGLRFCVKTEGASSQVSPTASKQCWQGTKYIWCWSLWTVTVFFAP